MVDNPLLWSISKKEALGSGKWSARKAQLAVRIYKKKGGGYLTKKSKNNSLYKWTKQNWRTKSGKNSVLGPNATGERYLPELFRISKKEYMVSTREKRKSLKKGQQYSKEPEKIKKRLSKFLRNYKIFVSKNG